ncbi:hypothetical protein Bbelb_221940 [Branchiostoma belcheri]|nr:hypothetical protein Bbelb_221940 [Branchiostoma belcheri]
MHPICSVYSSAPRRHFVYPTDPEQSAGDGGQGAGCRVTMADRPRRVQRSQGTFTFAGEESVVDPIVVVAFPYEDVFWSRRMYVKTPEPGFIQNHAQARFWIVHAYPEPCLGQIYVLGYAETIQNRA